MQQASAPPPPDRINSVAARDVRRLPPASLALWLALAICTAATVAGGHARTASPRKEQAAAASAELRPGGAPIMAIVSLRSQEITIYDSARWIMRAPVSSGQRGRETPAGVFSVLQKDADHHSNLYDDAWMPHMHRLTWSGIALHGGPLPGHAASHGCVRLPYDFASRLFELTKVGMRVIIAPGDVAPVEIAHPALFQPMKSDIDLVAAARNAEAQEAAGKADQARLAAVTASQEAARATTAVRVAENLKLRAQAQLAAVDRVIRSAASNEPGAQVEDAKTGAAARLAEVEAQLAVARAELAPKLDALAAARAAAVAAENARVLAAEAAQAVARDLEPVSVFISRKTQRLYVRQAFRPILESPVTIENPDRPVGTHVFTAMERSGGDGQMRWTVVSLRGSPSTVGAGQSRGRRVPEPEPLAAEPASAKEALDRIVIPHDVLDRVSAIASPRSSLIISDEALSSETGNGTEFVVTMSGEPQGGIKFRRRSPASEVRYDRFPYGRSRGPFSTW